MSSTIVRRLAASAGRAFRLAVRNPAEVALSVRMAFWVVLASGLARVLPLPRAHALVSTRVRPPRGHDTTDESAARLARAIDRVLRLDLLTGKNRCWRRALVLQRFLALHGIDSRVNFGVRTSGGVLVGHAWLERDGEPFLDDDASAYIVTFSLPGRPPSWESCSRG